MHKINRESDEDSKKIRISIDTKAVVNIGDFSRGGSNRQGENALDHDYAPIAKLTPFGMVLPQTKETFFWMATSKVTADFMADRIEEILPKLIARCPDMDTLVINADNGCESSGQRTQWLKRLSELSDAYEIIIQLAYYPPYHSKYNPIERCWGVLENHWSGELLTTIEKAVGLARSMTYAGINPKVRLVRKIYQNGVTLSKIAKQELEKRLVRKCKLEKWFIKIQPLNRSRI